MNPKPIAAVLAVVIRGSDVLLVRRINRPDAGLWGFPGGKIDRGESLGAAAVRELYEETQVRGEACGVVTAIDAFDRDDDGELHQHFILIAVLCRWVSGVPLASDDALEARWFNMQELAASELPMSRGVLEVAQQAAILVIGRES